MSLILDYLNKIDSIEEFENLVYESSELEENLNAEQYQNLLEFNYKSKDSSEKFENLLKDKILTDKEFDLWKLNKELIKSGWYKGRVFKIDNYNSNLHSEKALNILKEYGGLVIGNNTKNTRKIEFMNKIVVSDDHTLLATTEKSYVYLVMNSENEFYYNYDITNEYRYAGNCFKNILIEIILNNKPLE